MLNRATAIVAALCLSITGCTSAPALKPQPRATSQAQALEILATCLADQGWDMTISDDAVMSGDIPDEQIEAYKKDASECSANLVPDLNDLNDEQWHGLYDATMENVSCLKDNGFEFDNVPSFQSFQGMVGEWNAYQELIRAGQMARDKSEDWKEICPQPQYWP